MRLGSHLLDGLDEVLFVIALVGRTERGVADFRSRPSMAMAACRSAFGEQWLTPVATTRPCRFSLTACAMCCSFQPVFNPLRYMRASGSVIEPCVSDFSTSPSRPEPWPLLGGGPGFSR
jgi:hypothetical protein